MSRTASENSKQKTMSTQEKLRRARCYAGLTQGMTARISGLNRNTVSRYESTERKFKDSIICQWRRHVGSLRLLTFRKSVLANWPA